jgi:hypothetical protein
MLPVAVIMQDSELVRLLEHLRLPTDFPKTKPATKVAEAMCGPPGEECQLDPRADLYEAVDVPPADEFHSA